MEFSTIFTLVPYPKAPSLGDPVIFLPIWAFLFLVCLFSKIVTALWPSVLSYLSLVVAFASDKNVVVVVVSGLSLLRFWKPWAAATADLRREVDLAIDFTFLAWFLMASPFIVLTMWVGLMGVLRLAANAIVRRIHVAMEFEFDLTEYVVKCYSPMQSGSLGDSAVTRLLAASGNWNFALESSRPLPGLSKAGYDAIFRGKRPRRFVTKSFIEEEKRAQERLKKFVKECRAEIMAAKEVERIAAAQLNDPKPTPFDSEPVPQSRETPTPVIQVSAWPTVPESDNVAEDVTTANGFIETEEPADQKESKGEGLVGTGPKAPEPEVSSDSEGNGMPEGVEDSKAQEPESSFGEDGESFAEEPKTSLEEEGEGPLYKDSQAEEPEFSHEKEGEGFAEEPKSLCGEESEGPAEEPEFSYEKEGEGFAEEPEFPCEEESEGPAEEPKSSFREEGEGSLSESDPANDPEISFEVEGEAKSSATVPEAAQELETSFEEEGDGMLIDATQTEEPEVSFEAEGEGFTENKTLYEEEFDVEMVDVQSPEGAVPRPSSTTGYFDSEMSILPLEVVAPWSSAGQEPGYHYDTRGYMDLSPVVEIADFQTLSENEYASMNPDLLDSKMNDLLAGITTEANQAAVSDDSWFKDFAAWLDTVEEDADAAVPAAKPLDEDEEMRDVDRFPTPASDSEDGSVTIMESPISEIFGPSVLRDSSLDEEMAFMDLNGGGSDLEVEFVTAALAQLTPTFNVGNVIITEQQLSQEDVAMVELQKPIPPFIVVDMTELEEPIPPTDNTTELNGQPPPVMDMTEPEEPNPNVDDIVPDAVPDSPRHSASPPRSPYMGDDDEDWNEQDAVSDGLPPQTPTTSTTSPRDSEGGELSVIVSPGPSLEDDMMAAFEERDLMAALLGMSPDRLSSSRSTSPSSDDMPLWAFPPDMVDASSGAATNLSLNELFNNPRTIEGNPATEGAADDLSGQETATTDVVSGPDSVAEAQEPTPEIHTQAGSSVSPDDDTTLASGVVAEEQLPTTETPVPTNVPEIVVTPEPNRMVQVEVAPIRMGGLVLPGGNFILPATAAPMTPLPQQVKKPDPEALREHKEESLARDLRNVMRRRQPASIFHPKRPQKSSALIRSPEAAERENVLRSPQSFHALSRAGSDADGGADAVDEDAAEVMLASPAVMKAIRDSEARRGILREGNADER
ncbi:hypothetical protein V8C42DRAFT_354487 [Trichoderma barbatum]